MEERARIIIEVVAGVIPQNIMPEHTRRFVITSDVWYAQGAYEGKEQEAREEILKTFGYANEYMRSLWNPEHLNWVQMNWLYL